MRAGRVVPITRPVDDDLIPYNPVDRFKLPRTTRPPLIDDDSEEGAATNRYTIAEQQQIIRYALGALQRSPFALGVLLCGALGLRRGEALGLQWRDLDEQTGVLHVRRQIVRDSSGRHTASLKSTSSQRRLRLPAALVDQLVAIRTSREAGPGDWVCANSQGGELEPRDFTRWMREVVCADLGIPCHGLHGLRRGLATALGHAGVATGDVSHGLGHADERVTLKHYMGNDRAGLVDIAAALEALHGLSFDQAADRPREG